MSAEERRHGSSRRGRVGLRKAYVRVGASAIITGAILAFTLYHGQHLATDHSAQISAVHQATSGPSLVHLWFHEIVSGDAQFEMDEAFGHLELAVVYCRALVEGDVIDGQEIHAFKSEALKEQVSGQLALLLEIETVMNDLAARSDGAKSIAPLDIQFDSIFAEILVHGEALRDATFRELRRDLRRLRYGEVVLILSFFGLTALTFIILLRSESTLDSAVVAHGRSEDHLSTIKSMSPVGIFRCDREGRIIEANERAYEMAGPGFHSLEEDDLVLAMHPEDRESIRKAWYAAVTAKRSFQKELRFQHPDGKVLTVFAQCMPESDTSGWITSYVGTLTDITVLKQVENKLRYVQLALDYQEDPIYWVRKDGSIEYVNNAASEVLGFSREELATMCIPDIEPDFPADGWPDHWDEMKRAGTMTFEAHHRTKDGRVFPVEIRSYYLSFDGEEYVWAYVQDITEQKAIREQMRLQSAALDTAANSVVITDLRGDITWVNRAFVELTGYSREEVLGENPRILSSGKHEESFYGDLWETITRGEAWCGEITNKKKSGEIYVEEMTITPVRSDEGEITHFIAIKQDISERKRVETEKRMMEAQMRQQQKLESIGTLAGGVAHEINNPLQGIMSYASLIGERAQEDGEIRTFSNEIVQETKRVAEIVRNLLTFARHDSESHSLVAIDEIVEDTVSLIRTIIRRDQIEFEVDIPDDLPRIKCHGQQIQQVLMNILTNARDALNERYSSYDSNKIMRIDAKAVHDEGQDWVRITVEDHGNGIDDAIHDRIFDPFFTTKDRTKGTGLGMAISHGIMKDHKGRISFRSRKGEFTRVHVDLPVGIESSAQAVAVGSAESGID